MAEQKVILKFDGQAHQVDVETYTRTLLSYSAIIQAAAAEMGVDGPVRINIAANQPGSLDVLIQIASPIVSGILAYIEDNPDKVIEGVISLATGLLMLKQELAGKGKVNSTEISGDKNIVLITESGNVIVEGDVYSFYTNRPEATAAIDDAFTALDANPAISAIEICQQGKTTFRAEQGEFSAIATSQNHEPDDVKHDIVNNASLTIVKPCLAPTKTRKWEFYFRGNKISAPIQDEGFLSNLDQYSFQVGTTMRATLDITKVFDRSYKTYINKKYVVVKVNEVIPPQTTPPLF